MSTLEKRYKFLTGKSAREETRGDLWPYTAQYVEWLEELIEILEYDLTEQK